MFDSLALENPRRKWATMMSFMLETAFVGLAITTPLAFTEKLQLSKLSDVIVAPTSTAIDTAPQPSEVNPADATNRSEVNPDETLIAPMVIPSEVHRLVDTQQVAPSGVGEYVPGAVPGGGDTNPFMRRLIESIKPPVVVSASVPRTPVKISVLDPGFLVHRVEPIYPHNAILTRTEGSVTAAGRYCVRLVFIVCPFLMNPGIKRPLRGVS